MGVAEHSRDAPFAVGSEDPDHGELGLADQLLSGRSHRGVRRRGGRRPPSRPSRGSGSSSRNRGFCTSTRRVRSRLGTSGRLVQRSLYCPTKSSGLRTLKPLLVVVEFDVVGDHARGNGARRRALRRTAWKRSASAARICSVSCGCGGTVTGVAAAAAMARRGVNMVYYVDDTPRVVTLVGAGQRPE